MSKARRRRYYLRWTRYERRCHAAVIWWGRSMVPLRGIDRAADRVWADLPSEGKFWTP